MVATLPVSDRRFRRTQRILRTAEFIRAMRDGKRRAGAFLVLHAFANGLGYARLGIAVGRRVSGRATRRNTLKRVIRECFRAAAVTLPPHDLVFVVRPAAAALSNAEFATAVNAALESVLTTTDTPQKRRPA